MKYINRFLFASCAFLYISCAGSPVWKANQNIPDSANIVLVTHPGYIEGLRFAGGYQRETPGAFSTSQILDLVKYDVYEAGYRNVIVLIEIVTQGNFGTFYYNKFTNTSAHFGGNQGLVLVTIFYLD
jgi:hypothetical protein